MFEELLESLAWPATAGERTAIGPLPGSAPARFLCELGARGGFHLVVTPDTHTANALRRELGFYNRGLDVEVLSFPDWETLPYDNFSPHQDIISERLHSLYRLPGLGAGLLLVPVPTLMHWLPPGEYIAGNSLVLEVGQQLDPVAFRRHLERNGYQNVGTVYEHGEFAQRGSLLDIFPMGTNQPYRIDLFDGEVETLRSFDPETQRTVEKVTAINLLPAREFATDRASVQHFQHQWHQCFNVDHEACPMYREIDAGRVPGGSEYYLPLFFERCDTLFDYLPGHATVVTVGDHHRAAEQFWQEVQNRHEEFGIDPRRPLLPPARAFIAVEELYRRLQGYPMLELRVQPDAPVHHRLPLQEPPTLSGDQAGEPPAALLQKFMEEHSGPVLLCAETPGRREILLEMLSAAGLRAQPCDSWDDFAATGPALGITTAPLDRGLHGGPGQPTLVCEAQLFGDRVAQRRRRESDSAASQAIYKNINELRPGVPVVHIDHGVGRYLGLQQLGSHSLSSQGQNAARPATEFLALEYAGGDKLYVPVSSLHLISRYDGADPEHAPLHRLGSEQWAKARRKARQKVNDVAAELLEIYARRENREGFCYPQPGEDYQRFCAEFPFEETPDQEQAIAAVVADLCSPRVMDRLVCGDVGFGKTEVAMRAALIAALAGRQVAVLVPTTLLAQQHFNSFSDRFADWPVQVDVLSRFRSAAEQRDVIERVANGKVNLLIGTHRLLQRDIRYRDLGLLIIDEEHRFGVKQKDAIKALRAEVDILTLTATPIPRTLNLALGGMRDLSIISTPPPRRLSIKTFVRERNTALVKEAILRETLRGGQVYYLHNEVKSIDEAAGDLRDLLPDLRVGVAHGQMREQQLEQAMRAFYHQQYHVLVCSTIIETGIDVPNANTIIIERADKFGLAQLHQLRGRVGRSHHQAYAYLLCPPRGVMSGDAVKRLEAIEAAGDLGAGYLLATHDLEIRGAGELLGEEQSGQIQSVGYTLYMSMLERAVAALQKGEIPDPDLDDSNATEINLRLPALIPEDYLPDTNTRLVLYKRIAGAGDIDALQTLQAEMIDRFGLLPPPARNLFRLAATRLLATGLRIRKIDAGDGGGFFEFSDSTGVNPQALVELAQADPEQYRLSGGNRLHFKRELEDDEERYQAVQGLVEHLAEHTGQVAA